MLIRFLIVAAVSMAAVVVSVGQQRDPLTAASEALGAPSLKTVRVSGFGGSYLVGQSPSPAEAWPREQLRTYQASIDFDANAAEIATTRDIGGLPPRGGELPPADELRLTQFVNGSFAWDVPFAVPPRVRVDPRARTAQEVLGRGEVAAPVAQPPVPRPAAVEERALQITITPQGFLKGAIAHHASIRAVGGGSEATYVVGRHTITGFVNSRNEVQRVETQLDNPVLGDMPLVAEYSNYQKFGTIMYPTRIVQRQGGFPSLDLWITGVEPNVAIEKEVPESIRTTPAPTMRVDAERIADGVFYLKGGTHHSVVIEMADHLVLVEAPLNESRSEAVRAKLSELFPNKPVRYVINTHHHVDHAGGLRTYVDEGATIVTAAQNREYYERVWAFPRTLNPDRLSRSHKTATFRAVSEHDTLGTGARRVEIYQLANNPHAEPFLFVYHPASKLLVEADAFTPAVDGGTSQRPGTEGVCGAAFGQCSSGLAPSPSAINLYLTIDRLKLDVANIAALHGPRLATMADLAAAIGKN